MTMLSWKGARRVVVFVIGMTVLLIGIAGMVLPVLQAWLIIPLGLAILATEFVWARRLLDKAKAKAQQMSDKVRGRQSETQNGGAFETVIVPPDGPCGLQDTSPPAADPHKTAPDGGHPISPPEV